MVDSSLYLGKIGAMVGLLIPVTGVFLCFLIRNALSDKITYIFHFRYTTFNLYQFLSLLLFVFLIISGALISFGYFGLYKATEQSTAIRGMVFSILGTFGAGIFIVLSGIIPLSIDVVYLDYFQSTPVYPNLMLLDFSFLMLAIALIFSGKTLITVKELTGTPNLSSASGIISILSGIIFVIPMVLSWINVLQRPAFQEFFIFQIYALYDLIPLIVIVAFVLMFIHLLMLLQLFQYTIELV